MTLPLPPEPGQLQFPNEHLVAVGAVALFSQAADSFPDRPMLSLPLDHPGLRAQLLTGARQIGYRVV